MRTLIKNGLLIDPANRIQARLNLLLEDGRVALVTEECPGADQVIDAGGRVVAPGFIDIHMHEDPVQDGRIDFCIFDAMLRMGVTTAVGGNCGINVYDPVSYLDLLDRDGAPVNVAMFAGHEYFRRASGAEDKYGPVTEKQLSDIKKGLRAALDAGCVGISYGLRYVPGTDRKEFLETASCCEKDRCLISAHVRDDEDRVFGAVAEVAEAGQIYDIPVQISHIGSMGGFGQMEQLLRQVDGYRANGLDIACDCYPYFAFSTRIGTTTYDDGWLERYHCDYSACQLMEGKYKGQRCTAETFAEMRRDFPECLTVCYVMTESDIRMALRDPGVMVGSDGLIDNGQGHPRAAGTFPRFLAGFVREGDISLYDGIAKMTSVPAKRLGLSRKGRLNKGADADVVIFDPERIVDGARFDDPMLPPSGIDYVLIGGEIAAKDCKIVRQDLGCALRRDKKDCEKS
ncbi:MAG: amidohydrolase family protein [Clostridiales bacterium]|nr:amidohydrolase family protein [Clostridiales bacterium]